LSTVYEYFKNGETENQELENTSLGFKTLREF